MGPDETLSSKPPSMPSYWSLELAVQGESVLGKLRAALREARLLFWESAEGVVTAQIRADRVDDLCVHLERWLDSRDLDACRARLVEGGEGSDPPPAEPLRRVLARHWGRQLLSLLAEGRLRSRFQPIVRLGHPRSIAGYEVLLRGVARGDDLVPPDRLLDAACEADLLLQLDRAARRCALEAARARIPRGTIFVNSRWESLLGGDAFVTEIQALLAELGTPAKRLVIEIGPGCPAAEHDALERVVWSLRELGVGIALDDFGGPGASVDLLRRLRPDYTKLSRDLVQGIERDPLRQDLVEGLAAACREEGAAAIALGVEKRAELRWLEVRGIPLGQGYLFGVPADLPAGTVGLDETSEEPGPGLPATD